MDIERLSGEAVAVDLKPSRFSVGVLLRPAGRSGASSFNGQSTKRFDVASCEKQCDVRREDSEEQLARDRLCSISSNRSYYLWYEVMMFKINELRTNIVLSELA